MSLVLDKNTLGATESDHVDTYKCAGVSVGAEWVRAKYGVISGYGHIGTLTRLVPDAVLSAAADMQSTDAAARFNDRLIRALDGLEECRPNFQTVFYLQKQVNTDHNDAEANISIPLSGSTSTPESTGYAPLEFVRYNTSSADVSSLHNHAHSYRPCRIWSPSAKDLSWKDLGHVRGQPVETVIVETPAREPYVRRQVCPTASERCKSSNIRHVRAYKSMYSASRADVCTSETGGISRYSADEVRAAVFAEAYAVLTDVYGHLDITAKTSITDNINTKISDSRSDTADYAIIHGAVLLPQVGHLHSRSIVAETPSKYAPTNAEADRKTSNECNVQRDDISNLEHLSSASSCNVPGVSHLYSASRDHGGAGISGHILGAVVCAEHVLRGNDKEYQKGGVLEHFL